MSICVVKIGGSLLTKAGLRARFETWHLKSMKQRSGRAMPGSCLLLVGGGETVDALRRLQPSLGCSDEAAHFAAIELMDLHAKLLAQAWGGLPLVTLPDSTALVQREARDALDDNSAPLKFVALGPLLGSVDSGVLPRNWSVTSDSIAAFVATLLNAELVLLKSAPAPCDDWSRWHEQGYVDPWFPNAAKELTKVSAVDI